MKRIALAAEQGSAHAQNNLGIIYRNGNSALQTAPNRHIEAAKWFRRAAEQGHPDAQHSLGVMCSAGQGVQQNLVQAYMWLSLATTGRQGINRALSIQARDVVAATMTAAQITRAKRLVREWRSRTEVSITC